jgi:Winged helix DNA-binding domain
MGDRFAMTRTLPPDLARALLARAQRLAGAPRSSVVDSVRAVAGLQAQDAAAAQLGIRARRPGSTLADVEHARFEERSVARTWVMRGTLHLIPAEDARWMVALLGPIGLKKSARRIAELRVGLPEAVAAVRAELAGGPMTRRELADAVRARGVDLPDDPQVPAWLTGVVALRGEIIEGPANAFVLVDDWLGPPGPEPDDPVLELARRHAHAYPPAGPEDFAAWSGLPMREARRGYAQLDLEEVEVLGRRVGVPRGLEPAPPHVRLLPMFDSLLLGHRDRSLIVRPEHASAVMPGGGILAATLVADGRIEGTWELERGRPVVTTFGEPPDYDAEVADVERFRHSQAG